MTSDVSCAQCSQPIAIDYQTNDSSQREPCPNCGSIARAHSDSGMATLSIEASGHDEVVIYPRILLNSAKQLCSDGQYNIAVVVAHMACEVAIERKLAEAFAERKASYLQEPIYDLLSGFNLGNDKLRKLYTALTGDQVQSEPFWKSFTESVTRRNKIIHKGMIVTKDEAEASLNATDNLVMHLGM